MPSPLLEKIELPRTELPMLESINTPELKLKAMVLPAPGVVPPMVLSCDPKITTIPKKLAIGAAGLEL